MNLENALIGLALVFVVHPLIASGSLAPTALKTRERLTVAFHGVRGIGSISYLACAGHHVELVNEAELWATIAFTIVLPTAVHGLTAGVAVGRATGESHPPPDTGGS